MDPMWFLAMWSKMNGSSEGEKFKMASEKMIDWISAYFEQFVTTLVPFLSQDFKIELERRKDAFYWLQNLNGNSKLAHHWWTNAAVVDGLDTSLQTLDRDAEPSILINLGTKVIFEIDNSRVALHPMDVLIFNGKLPHRVVAVNCAAKEKKDDNFAVKLRFRQDILQKVGTKPDKPVPFRGERRRPGRAHVPSELLPAQGSNQRRPIGIKEEATDDN